MIHTAEIIKKITENEYYILTTAREVEYRSGTAHIYALAEYGITDIKITSLPIPNTETHAYYCTVIINLARLCNGGKQTYSLFSSHHKTADLYAYFKQFMSAYLPLSCDLQDWTTRRIDYTVDIKTPFVEAHIKALQRGRKPKRRIMADNGQHKQERHRRHLQGSVRYHNKSTIVNIYDKHYERLCKQRERGYTDLQELAHSENVLRIEVQCLKAKTAYIKTKKNFDEKELKYYLCQYEEMRNILLTTYTQIAGTANYYTYEQATRIIKQSHYRDSTKAAMLRVLEMVSGNRGTRSVWKAGLKYSEQYPHGIAFKTLLHRFEEIGLNPVTVSREIGFLPNLSEEIRSVLSTQG